jgi:hypothetical protein
MRKISIALALAALIAVPATAQAAPCKDAKGKFIKCSASPAPAAVATKAAVAAKVEAKTAKKAAIAAKADAKVAKKAATKAKGTRCRDSKGRFAKC